MVSSLVVETREALVVERDVVDDCNDSLAMTCESFCAEPLPLRLERVSLMAASGLVCLLPGVTFRCESSTSLCFAALPLDADESVSGTTVVEDLDCLPLLVEAGLVEVSWEGVAVVLLRVTLPLEMFSSLLSLLLGVLQCRIFINTYKKK